MAILVRSSVNDQAVDVARQIVAELFGPAEERPFAVEYWDGTTDPPSGQTASAPFTLVLRDPGGLRRMLLPPSELAFAEGYLRDEVDIEGDLEAAAAVAASAAARLGSPGRVAHVVRLALELPSHAGDHDERHICRSTHLAGQQHSKRRDLSAVQHHYDLGNDFYQLWLDRQMVYSSAYFADEADDLDTAQTAKLDRICRKLCLRPGDRLLDIGCGWGGLIMFAAEHYGVDALGITISQAQLDLARARIAAAGLNGRCRVELCDYRDIPPGPHFDRIASIGMVEHVGLHQLSAYLATAFGALRPGGLFLLSGIVAPPHHPVAPTRLARILWHEGQFIDRYVFPDGELVPLARIVDLAEQAGFETRDVENLREHYARTLRHWVRRLEASHDAAVALVGEETYRVWRLYLAGSAHTFAAGRIGITETLLRKPPALPPA